MPQQFNERALIRLVEGRSILYAKGSGRSSEVAEKKNEAWSLVAERLGASERACITRWRSLRDRFVRELRRLQEDPTATTCWSLFGEMAFLKEHLKHANELPNSFVESIQYTPKVRHRRRLTQSHADEIEDDAEFVRSLIAQIREFPVLYDRQLVRDVKNMTAKNEAWKTIAANLGTTDEHCNRVWKRVRDRFSREYREIQATNGSSSWMFYEDTKFLEAHFRRTCNTEKCDSRLETHPPHVISDCVLEVGDEMNTTEELGDIVCFDECSNRCVVVKSDSINDNYLSEIHDQQAQVIDVEIIPNDTEEEQQECYEPQHFPAFEEYVDAPQKCEKLKLPVTEGTAQEHLVTTPVQPAATQLLGVITKVRQVLHESERCYNAMESQAHRQQGQPPLSDNLSRVQMLLSGLPDDQRIIAQRKIMHFLFECQIKNLHNQNVEDVPKMAIN